MPIFKPGEKFRHSKILKKRKTKRDVVALLSLTAMVDMFTVLAIFLLQNYNTTGQVIYIPKEVTLPKAEKIKELKPAVVVTISTKEVLLENNPIMSLDQVKQQSQWMLTALYSGVQEALKKSKDEYEKNFQKKLQKVVENARGEEVAERNPWSKVTIQSDKGIDFLTVKKIMYTVTEAGAGEINFAVTKQKDSP